jgi:hypothetical protein
MVVGGEVKYKNMKTRHGSEMLWSKVGSEAPIEIDLPSSPSQQM